MGMIFAGMTEGLGNGITAIAHNEAAMDAALAKLHAQKEVSDMQKQAAMYASDNRLKGVEDRISAMAANAGKGGAGDPDIQSPERARMLAAMELKINGAQAQQMEDYATTGRAPMVTQYQQLVQQKDAFDADPSAQGTATDGSSVDYSDATTRRLQQQSTTQTTVARDVIDPAFADMYASKSQAAANSYRKSFQPKEYKSMAEGDSEKQQQGLINSVALGGPNATNAGKALTLVNGGPIYNNSGVNTVDGSGTSYSKSQENVNNAQAAGFLAKAAQVQSGELSAGEVIKLAQEMGQSAASQMSGLDQQDKVLRESLATAKAADKSDIQAQLSELATRRVEVQKRVDQAATLMDKVTNFTGRSTPTKPAPAAAPANAPPVIPKMSAGNVQKSIVSAKTAIASGRDRDMVIARLKAHGINTDGI